MAGLKVGSSEFLDRLRRQFKDAMEAEREIREEAERDIAFRAGDQWDPAMKRLREANDRPVLVFNKVNQFVATIANEARKNKPSAKFVPVDDSADVDTAKVMEELARAIRSNSDADIADEIAIDHAAGSSFGYIRVLTDYCDDESFDQDVKFAPVVDPFAVYGVLVPSAFGRRVPFAFVCETLTKDEFEQQYPDAKDVTSWGLEDDNWVAEDSVRVAEYWWVEWSKRTIQSEDGEEKRTVQVPTIYSCKTNGFEVFEGTETTWVGSTIPIIPVLGSQLVVDGKLKLFSIVRWIRDPQVLINFAKTRIVETLGTAPVSPFIGPAGFMRGREEDWRRMNIKVTPALEYEVVDVAGHPLPPPSRQVYEPPIGALSAFVAQEEEDLKSGTGIYDARLGARSNETSGIAIQQRNQQSETANYHFLDNLARAQRQAFRILAEIVPKIYDAPRWLRIIGEDETERMVRVNEAYIDRETGKTQQFMLGAGKYDVRVTVGPSFSTKRSETANLIQSALQAAPQLMSVVGDLFFRSLDVAGAEEMADRMKRYIASQAPGLIEEKKGPQQEIPPQVQQKLQQSGQMIEQLTAALNEANAKLESKQPEIESKEKIEAAKLELEREKIAADLEMKRMDVAAKAAQIESQQAIEQLRQEIELLKSKQSAEREDEREERDREFTRESTQGAGTDAAVGE